MNCTMRLPNNDPCSNEATDILAWPMLEGKAIFVAPYCANHAADMESNCGGRPAAGPALSKDAQLIEGIRGKGM